jgi:hypothetical protein
MLIDLENPAETIWNLMLQATGLHVYKPFSAILGPTEKHPIDFIEQRDDKNTLFLCEPTPYYNLTVMDRPQGKGIMTYGQHLSLLSTLADIKGKFILSGVQSCLYDDFATIQQLWTRFDVEGGGVNPTETFKQSVWTNFRRSDR